MWARLLVRINPAVESLSSVNCNKGTSARRAYFFRHRGRLFGRDPRVDGDNETTRHVRIEVILVVWLGLTTLLVVEWVELWIN